MGNNNNILLLNASANGVAGSAGGNFLDDSASNRVNKSSDRQIIPATTSSFNQ